MHNDNKQEFILTTSKISPSEFLLKDIRHNTKRILTSEQKVLIVMEGIRGEYSIVELCRKYGMSDSTYYKWNKDFMDYLMTSRDIYLGQEEKIKNREIKTKSINKRIYENKMRLYQK